MNGIIFLLTQSPKAQWWYKEVAHLILYFNLKTVCPNITSLVSTSGRVNGFMLTVGFPVEFRRSLTEFELEIFVADERFGTFSFSFLSCELMFIFTTSTSVARGKSAPR